MVGQTWRYPLSRFKEELKLARAKAVKSRLVSLDYQRSTPALWKRRCQAEQLVIKLTLRLYGKWVSETFDQVDIPMPNNTCTHCGGSGEKATGYEERYSQSGIIHVWQEVVDCPHCQGLGWVRPMSYREWSHALHSN